MKFPIPLLLAAAIAWGFVDAAPLQSADDATPAMLADLEAALRNLEAEAKGVEKPPADISDRVEKIRQETIYLQVKMRKHQESGKAGTGVSTTEVRELMDQISAARRDLRQVTGDRASGSRTIPAGSEISVRLKDTLTTATAEPGDRFQAAVIEPVRVRDELALPAGALFEGVVEVADRAEGRTDRKAKMVLAFERVIVDGKSYEVEATVMDASGEDLETGIGDEKEKVGIAAGLGTILGAVLGGTKGAVVGAVLGGAGVILATEGKEVELPRGTVIRIRLDKELRIDSVSSE